MLSISIWKFIPRPSGASKTPVFQHELNPLPVEIRKLRLLASVDHGEAKRLHIKAHRSLEIQHCQFHSLA